MKKGFALAFILLWQMLLLGVEPVISSLTVVARRDGSRKVDIRYHLSSVDTTRVFVRAELSYDEGESYRNIPYRSLNGDIGWVVPNGQKHIVWDQNYSERQYEGDGFVLRLDAGDNLYIASNKRYIALGNADFFPEDYTIIIPLLRKYGFGQTFYLQTRPLNSDPNLSYYSGQDLALIEESGSDMGDHVFAHFAMMTTFPLADGYNSPTNEELRNDRGDGRNAFGIALSATVGSICISDYLYFSGASYANRSFAQLNDADCEDIRRSLSVFRRPTAYYQGSFVRLLEALDYLSNRYLGTTGTGRNILIPAVGTALPVYGDSVLTDALGRIAGGIFQGCYTTQNHELWERMMRLHSLFHDNILSNTQQTKSWFSCGGLMRMFLYRNLGTVYDPGYAVGIAYMDAQRTLPASVYTPLYNSRTGQWRSLYDAQRSVGYRTGFEAGLEVKKSDGRFLTHFLIPNKLNSGAFTDDYDCLATPHGMMHDYLTGETGFSTGELNEIATTDNLLLWLYDRDRIVHDAAGRGLYHAVNDFMKWTTWGTIPKYSDDTGVSNGPNQQSARFVLQTEVDMLFKYCYLAGIQVVSYEDAIDICQQELPPGTNLFPNPCFAKTIDDVIGSSVNPQTEPDGWVSMTVGALSDYFDNDLDAQCLSLDAGRTAYIRQYMIEPGQLYLEIQAKGHGSLRVYGILNKTPTNAVVPLPDLLANIRIDGEEWQIYNATITIPIAPLVTPSYQFQYMNGKDNQICGLSIQIVSDAGSDGLDIGLPVLTAE